jgi:hypothetical protein
VERRLSLYKALNLVHFQKETSELEVARYSFIRDNIVDKIEQKNKKDGMWSDDTMQSASCKYEHSGEILPLLHVIILDKRVCHVYKMWNNADWEENEQI